MLKLWESDTFESLLKTEINFPLGPYDCIKTEKKEVCKKGTCILTLYFLTRSSCSRIENEVGDFLCM